VNLYIAGAWTDRTFLRNVRTALIDHGHQVTARWLDAPDDGNHGEWAAIDLEDIRACDTFLLFADVPSSSGGSGCGRCGGQGGGVVNDMNQWESLFGQNRELPEGDPDFVPEPQPPDDHPLVIAIAGDDDVDRYETGLTGTWINQEFVVPFASVENAVDCFRVLIRDLSRPGHTESA
jgi:hypothetical protein